MKRLSTLPDIGKTKKALAQARRRTVSLKDPAPPSTTLAYDSPCLCQWLLRLGKPFYKDKNYEPPMNEILPMLYPTNFVEQDPSLEKY